MEAVKSIKECWKEAWTFPGPRPPHEAKLIDVREDADGGKSYLYEMPDGSYLFDTDRSRAFALEMEAAQKRHGSSTEKA